jgi:hypothetical protein
MRVAGIALRGLIFRDDEHLAVPREADGGTQPGDARAENEVVRS